MQSVATKSTGKLYAELCPGNGMSRDNFEECLGAMARAQLLRFADAVFEKQGEQIPYRTVRLTAVGRAVDESEPVFFVMKDTGRLVPLRKHKKKSGETEPSSISTARTRSGQRNAASALSESEP